MTNRRYPRRYSDGGDTAPPSIPYVPDPSADTNLKRGGRRYARGGYAEGGDTMCHGGRRRYDEGGAAQPAPAAETQSKPFDLWGTLGHVAETVAPFLPLLLAPIGLKEGGEAKRPKRLRRAMGGVGKTRKHYPYT